MYKVELPQMSVKTDSWKVGATVNANILWLKGVTYQPTAWTTSNAKVATVDSNGNVKFLKKGSVNIIAVFGEGKNSSKKKYKVKVKVS